MNSYHVTYESTPSNCSVGTTWFDMRLVHADSFDEAIELVRADGRYDTGTMRNITAELVPQVTLDQIRIRFDERQAPAAWHDAETLEYERSAAP